MHKFIAVFSLSFLISFSSQAKLLDKIIAVINDQIFTLSQVNRIQSTYKTRAAIAPQIFKPESNTQSSIVTALVNIVMVKEKLKELGYIISDEQVEDQIKATETRLRLTRAALLNFLESNGLTFEEYFEMIRATYEFNIFMSRVISPLVSITDQEIKNEYLRLRKNNTTIAFHYDLEDFSIPAKSLKSTNRRNLCSAFLKYKESGELPTDLKDRDTNVLNDISEDYLKDELKKDLRGKEEGEISAPILIGEDFHCFYINKKNLVESEDFKSLKPRIKQKLMERELGKVLSLWYKRQEGYHFIKKF